MQFQWILASLSIQHRLPIMLQSVVAPILTTVSTDSNIEKSVSYTLKKTSNLQILTLK